MKVLNFGSLNIDYVYEVDHIVQGGETLSSQKLNIFCGGKGLNQSIALSRAGVNVYHAGMVGEDGNMLLEACFENNINTKYIKKIDQKNGHAIIQLDKSAENSILLYGGSNKCITKSYVDEVLANFQYGDLILLQNEINEISYIIDEAYKKGMKIVLNPSPLNESIISCDLSKISVFILNEIEGQQITTHSKPEDIISSMKEKYPKSSIVLTLGSDGVIYCDDKITVTQEAYNVKAIDTTAAGDTFTGYFIASIIDNIDIKEGLERSSKAAAIAVSRKGAANSIPYIKEVLEI